MSEVIFAVPRHDYASYRDLYRLIELSAFPTCYIDEVDPDSDNAYIVTILNGESQNGWRQGRARIILYDLEYHLPTDGYHREAFKAPPGVAEVWAGDKWYAEQIGARYVPMGSHPGLRARGGVVSQPKLFDIAYIGYINGVPRRERIRQELIQHGVKVSPPVAWGDERDAVLLASTAYLHVHQWDNVPTIAPLRMVVAAAYSLPVISEMCADAGEFERYLIQTGYGSFASNVERVLRDPDNEQWLYIRHGNGSDLHHFLCHDLTFRKSVEAAL